MMSLANPEGLHRESIDGTELLEAAAAAAQGAFAARTPATDAETQTEAYEVEPAGPGIRDLLVGVAGHLVDLLLQRHARHEVFDPLVHADRRDVGEVAQLGDLEFVPEVAQVDFSNCYPLATKYIIWDDTQDPTLDRMLDGWRGSRRITML